jgi:hypothetical protein
MSDDDGPDGSDVFVFNPLPWEREVSGPVPHSVVHVRGGADDQTAGRHFQDRGGDFANAALLDGDAFDVPGDGYALPPTTVPGYGYTVVEREALREGEDEEATYDERAVVETDRYRIEFDRERGGVAAWHDRELDCEWVDGDADDPLAGFVHEEVADREHDSPRSLLYRYPPDADWGAEIVGITDNERAWQPDWHAERTRPEGVVRHRVHDVPDGYDVRQRIAVPAVESDVVLRVFVPEDGATVTVEAAWEMGTDDHPQSTYLAFPFDLDDPTARLDVGAQAMEPGADQLDGSCHDYYTAQRWADLSDDDRGMTVACPLNPIVQFGDFSYGANAREFTMERPQLLGWVTNTYWETNFRASQPGGVFARYHLTPHGEFDEGEAHRRGLEAEHDRPLAQAADEPSVADAPLDAEASLLDLPEPPVLVTQIRPDRDGPGVYQFGDSEPAADAMLVRLRNASDESQSVDVGSGALTVTDARRVGALGGSVEDDTVPVTDGTATVELDARETATLRLDCE